MPWKSAGRKLIFNRAGVTPDRPAIIATFSKTGAILRMQVDTDQIDPLRIATIKRHMTWRARMIAVPFAAEHVAALAGNLTERPIR